MIDEEGLNGFSFVKSGCTCTEASCLEHLFELGFTPTLRRIIYKPSLEMLENGHFLVLPPPALLDLYKFRPERKCCHIRLKLPILHFPVVAMAYFKIYIIFPSKKKCRNNHNRCSDELHSSVTPVTARDLYATYTGLNPPYSLRISLIRRKFCSDIIFHKTEEDAPPITTVLASSSLRSTVTYPHNIFSSSLYIQNLSQ